MSKPALSASRHSSSSSSLSSRPTQPSSRFQLLHDLPASLLSQVCSFLSVYQVVSTLRCTCHVMHGSVTPDCLREAHLAIRGYSLPALAASKPDTRALVSRVRSLSILYKYDRGETGPRTAMLPLQSLQDAPQFLFCFLSSLHIVFELDGKLPFPPSLRQACLLDVMQLLTASPESFSSLRRLHIDDTDEFGAEGVELSFAPLARLPALADFRCSLRTLSPSSCSTLMSALESMQCLTSLDMRHVFNTCSQLLQLLCAESNTPLLLRLKSLILPGHSRKVGHWDELHDTFLCRLSSLPAPPALQQFTGVPTVRHSAAGLLSIFSLPRLTQLDLTGRVRCSELSAFISSFTSAPAPLVSLTMPGLLGELNDGGDDMAATPEDAGAACSAVRRLLSRFTELRHLRCDAHLARGAVALPDSRPGSGTSGCSGSLYSLSVWQNQLSVFPFIASLSFPQLTELVVTMPMTDAELELLLSACPQLLRLDHMNSRSWSVVLIAARCCAGLLQLTVHVDAQLARGAHNAAVAAPPPVASPFLPQLVTLCLVETPTANSRFSVLRHFTAPPHAQLQHVFLIGDCLGAQHVLLLACLPRLCHLEARSCLGRSYYEHDIAQVEKAYRRTRQQLLSCGAAGSAAGDAYRPGLPSRVGECCVGQWPLGPDRQREWPLGPHQQHEMRQRVMQAAAAPWWTKNLLASAAGVDADTVRAVFFAELRSAHRKRSSGS